MPLSTSSLFLSLLFLSQIIISSATDYGTKLEPMKSEPENGNYDSEKEHRTDSYGRSQGFAKFKRDDYRNGLKSEKKLTYIIGVQGLIYCKVGSKLIPLKGALARITCLTVDKDGHESAPFSLLTKPTNAKGYFSAKVSPYAHQNYENAHDLISQCKCKAFLEKSPWESCGVATDINKGIDGASLSKTYRVIGNNVRLYSVGPFVYSPVSNPSSNKY